MPLKSRPHVPPHTAHAARSAYGPDDPYLLVGDRLGCWLQEIDPQLPRYTFLSEPRWDDLLLALVTVFQKVEHLPDRPAADAVRTRLDWKYALHLPLDHPGLEHAVLGAFRRRLLGVEPEQLAFQSLLSWLAAVGFIGGKGSVQEACCVLRDVDALAWVHEAGRAMSEALEAIATLYPDWLRQIALPHWYQRYGHASWNDGQVSLAGCTCWLGAMQGDVAYLVGVVNRTGAPELGALGEIRALRALQHDLPEMPGRDGTQESRFSGA
jgi:hypothetical protein